MSASARIFLLIAGINGALVVALGAFGAHFLKARVPADLMTVYHTGILYHGIHALGLLAIGVVAGWLPRSGFLRAAGWTMLGGILAFSGSLYLLSVTGVRWLGAITPVGGTAFIVAWILFCVAVLRAPD